MQLNHMHFLVSTNPQICALVGQGLLFSLQRPFAPCRDWPRNKGRNELPLKGLVTVNDSLLLKLRSSKISSSSSNTALSNFRRLRIVDLLTHAEKSEEYSTLAQQRIQFDPKQSPDFCPACVTAKMHQTINKESSRTTRNTLELVHSDVCGLFEVESRTKKRYITFIDDYSRYTQIYAIRHKSDVLEKLKDSQQ